MPGSTRTEARPISLAAAFEDAVRSQISYADPSRDAISSYAARLHEYWGTDGLAWHGHAALADKPAPASATAAPTPRRFAVSRLGCIIFGIHALTAVSGR